MPNIKPMKLVDIGGGEGELREFAVDDKVSLANLPSLDPWSFIPIGMKFPLDTHTPGVTEPPTSNPDYRYIKLTASDSYNTGVLTSETVSGSAPLVHATAVISDPGSALNGQPVRLINTERRVIRAGSSGSVEADAMQTITGYTGQYARVAAGANPNGAFTTAADGSSSLIGSTGSLSTGLNFSSANSPGARTDNETRMKNIGATYYMRIR